MASLPATISSLKNFLDLSSPRARIRTPFDIVSVCGYNVITMTTTIISIGNSKGVRIPKLLLDESGLENEVELVVKKGEIRIIPAKKNKLNDTLLMSEKALETDWNRPEEDDAWKSLQ